MNHCVMCGERIPDNQRTCSMCYGDVDHGSDGYYRRFMEQQPDQERPPEERPEEINNE